MAARPHGWKAIFTSGWNSLAIVDFSKTASDLDRVTAADDRPKLRLESSME